MLTEVFNTFFFLSTDSVDLKLNVPTYSSLSMKNNKSVLKCNNYGVMGIICRFCVKRNYLDAVILKFSGKDQVALLHSHMTTVLQVLSLDLTKHLGNVTFQNLIFRWSTIGCRLTFSWSLKLECFLIKKQERCPFTMSLTK